MSKNIILATIYKLVFKDNTNIAYVGQSTNINSRFKQHIKNAKDFSNIDNKLYFFMNLYGIHNFYIEVIEIFNNISQIELNNNEQKYIQLYGSINTMFSNSNISIQITKSLIQQLLTKLHDDNISQNIIKQISNSLYNKYSLNSSNNTIQKLNDNKNTVMTTDQSVEYINKIKEQNRLRQQKFIEKKKITGEYEAYNEKRTEYKREYRNKNKIDDVNNNKNTVITTDQSLEYMNKIKEQNRLRQQRFIEKKKTTGEYEAYNKARTEYKKKYRNKPDDVNSNTSKLHDYINNPSQSPTANIQSPTANIQSPTDNIQSPTDNIQSPTDNIQSPTANIQSPTANIQSPTATD